MTPQTKPKLERNILAVYYGATDQELHEGLAWYTESYRWCETIAAGYGIELEKVAGVVAALSPGLQWSLNQKQAEEVIRYYVAGATLADIEALTVGVYGRPNRRKCYRILRSDGKFETILAMFGKRGPKTRAFYHNIARPWFNGPVCVDRHAKCAAYNVTDDRDRFGSVKEHEYAELERTYQNAASKVDVLPHELQAIVWVVWRNNMADLER